MKCVNHFSAALALAVMMLASCDKSDDPSAVTLKNLKNPNGLVITENGDKSVRLTWNASNFGGDFQGYNVYGVKMDDEDIAALAAKGLEKGKPVQLLDSDGNASDDAKDILQSFNYDTDNPLNAAKELEPANDEARKISFLPIHNVDADGDPVLPTCYPSKSGTSYSCASYTETNADEIKGGSLSANGSVYYDITGLVAGDQYCFIVFSVQDDGKEISQTSSNFECVRPSEEITDDSVVISGDNKSREFLVRTLVTTCQTACPTDISASFATESGTVANATSTGAVYLEVFGSKQYLTAGANCGILEMGVRSGLSDATLPSTPPTFDNAVADGKALNSNGYSPAGASILLLANHAYVLACDDTAKEDRVYYHWLFVNSSTNPALGSAVPLKIRLGQTSVAR